MNGRINEALLAASIGAVTVGALGLRSQYRAAGGLVEMFNDSAFEVTSSACGMLLIAGILTLLALKNEDFQKSR